MFSRVGDRVKPSGGNKLSKIIFLIEDNNFK